MTDPFEKVFGQQGKEAGRELAIATCYELAMKKFMDRVVLHHV
jgi:hypothetical protein